MLSLAKNDWPVAVMLGGGPPAVGCMPMLGAIGGGGETLGADRELCVNRGCRPGRSLRVGACDFERVRDVVGDVRRHECRGLAVDLIAGAARAGRDRVVGD